MAEFLSMGGYGFYIWLSYGVVVAVLVYHYFSPLRKRKKLLEELAAELPRRNTEISGTGLSSAKMSGAE